MGKENKTKLDLGLVHEGIRININLKFLSKELPIVIGSYGPYSIVMSSTFLIGIDFVTVLRLGWDWISLWKEFVDAFGQMEIKVENAISVGRSGEEGRNFDKIFKFLQGQVSI